MASKTLGRFILKTIGVLLFCAVSGYALFLAYGYNLDLKHQNIEKTSIIDIASRYPEVRVYLDEKIIGNSIPLQIKDLLPGFYNLSVNKLGYLPWNRKLEVQTDIVTKVDDVVLVPEHSETLVQQLVRFPEDSRYFFSKDFFIVHSAGHDYLTLVYLLEQGKMKEEELKLSRQDIRDIHIYTPQKFLVTFEDGTFEWVEFNGPRFVDFELPKGSSELTFLASRNAAFFLNGGGLYHMPIDLLPTLTAKNLPEFLLKENVDQFDVHDDRLVYLSKGMAYASDIAGENVRLVDRSGALSYIRFLPNNKGSSGVYVVRTLDNKRLAYAADERGTATLLTPQLKGEVYRDNSGRFIFTDESGNIFLYKPLTDKKTLVTTLPTDFSLIGFLFDDGHFVFARQQKVFLADSLFTNVYALFDYQEKARYFPEKEALFFLNEHKLKSFFFFPKD